MIISDAIITITHCSRFNGSTLNRLFRKGASITITWRKAENAMAAVRYLFENTPSRNRDLSFDLTFRLWASWISPRVAKAIVIAVASE